MMQHSSFLINFRNISTHYLSLCGISPYIYNMECSVIATKAFLNFLTFVFLYLISFVSLICDIYLSSLTSFKKIHVAFKDASVKNKIMSGITHQKYYISKNIQSCDVKIRGMKYIV